MTHRKYFSGNQGQYLFCDICGQACYVFEATKLAANTGRGGLYVCPSDKDNIDFGLVPYTITSEHPVPYVRINHTNLTNGTAVLDYETATSLGT